MTQRAPGPEGRAAISVFERLRARPAHCLLELFHQYGDVVRLQMGPFTTQLLSAPAHVKHVLTDHAVNYTKRAPVFRSLQDVLGDGILTAEGDAWRSQRRVMQPGFQSQRIHQFDEIVTASAKAMLDEWEAPARAGDVIDIHTEMQAITMRVVGQALLSTDLIGEAKEVGEALGFILEQVSTNPMFAVSTDSETGAKMDAAKGVLDGLVNRIIETRRQDGHADDGRQGDLLDLLLQVEGVSNKWLRDNVATMFVAGFETTAATLTWALHVLGTNQTARDAIRDEVQSTLQDRVPRAGDLAQLPKVHAFLMEVMRLYPAVWLMQRRAIDHDEIGGFEVPRGSTVLICPYVTHRHPSAWPDPERFDHSRFLAPSPDRPLTAHIPFSSGQRSCIGKYFAIMEASLVIAMVAQRYRLSPADDGVEFEPALSLRPKDGLRMRAHRYA